MPMEVAVVAVGPNILSRSASPLGKPYIDIVAKILETIPRHDNRMSYIYEGQTFHYIVEHELIYMCMADQAFGRRIPFSFLENLKHLFTQKYAPGAGRLPDAHVLQPSQCQGFESTIKEQMKFFNEDPNADRLRKVRGDVDKVKDDMLDNIDTLLDRGQKISVVLDKTDDLNESAFQFKKKAKTLKCEMLKKKIKLIVALACILLVLLVFIIVFAACGTDFCTGD